MENVTITNEEYKRLIRAQVELDLIIEAAEADGYGASDVIKVLKARRTAVTTADKEITDA